MARQSRHTRTLIALGALAVPLLLATPAAAQDPCVSFGSTPVDELAVTYNVIVGTDGSDQIIGTDLPDIIFGRGGDDVLKGGGGADVLCGESGHDGLNGDADNDVLGGGSGNDLVVGAAGDDQLWGGTGNDGVYGGDGADTVTGDTGVDDAAYDYLAGGVGSDTMSPRGSDESFQYMQGDTACPSSFARRIGAYGSWENTSPRLAPQGSGCKTIRGKVKSVNAANDNDGDLHMRVCVGPEPDPCANPTKVWIVEFMPRDFAPMPLLGVGNDVELTGLHVIDSHGNEEIHPVFRLHRVNANETYYSGPMYAGSPERIRPSNVVECSLAVCDNRVSHRFCWNQNGVPCTPWATVVPPSGDVEPFQVVLSKTMREDVARELRRDDESYQ